MAAFGAMLAGAGPALADQCAYNKKAVAEAALKHLPKGAVIQEWCPTCDNKPGSRATKRVVASAAVKKVDYQDYYGVYLDGGRAELDLAYAFVGGDKPKGSWQNLGALTKCELTGEVMKVLPAHLVAR